MKARIRHFYEIIAGMLLSLLGFTSCNKGGGKDDPYEDIKAEYGMPHADYVIQGTVTSADDNKPIKGIKATFRRLQYVENGKKYYEEMPFTTDGEGKVNGSFQAFPLGDEEIDVLLEDVDGAENGYFMGKRLPKADLNISLDDSKKGSWYTGKYTISFEASLYEEAPAEYGMPHAKYKIIGTVTDPEGNPIPGIEILAKLWQTNQNPEEGEPMEPGQTNASGKFSLEGTAMPEAVGVHLELNDIDGEQNGGLFESAKADAQLEKQGEGDGNWFDGTFGATLDVQLKKAE